MKFYCGKTWHDRDKARRQWHKKFLFLPERVGKNDCRWLETVERRKIGVTFDFYDIFEFRPLKK